MSKRESTNKLLSQNILYVSLSDAKIDRLEAKMDDLQEYVGAPQETVIKPHGFSEKPVEQLEEHIRFHKN